MILKFQNPVARKEFLERVARERRDIFEHCRPAKRLPHVFAQELTSEQEAWLEKSVADSGSAFRDIPFQTF